MTLRLNLTQSLLAFLFRTEQPCVSDAIESVCQALEKEFVSDNLGYNQPNLTRDDATRDHSRKLVNKLFCDAKEEDVMFLIADGTYIYVQKPTDFAEQMKTFSMHKHRNLQKCIMIILPSGYILEAAGMYGADGDNNDAKIMEHLIKYSPLRLFIRPRDRVISDRGFRDGKAPMEESGLIVLMLEFLAKNHKQFSTAEGNSSRKVKMVRWTVEAVNGRLKNVFRFFEAVVPGSYKSKIGRFIRIACAILNKYYGPIMKDKDHHERLEEVVTERADWSNGFQQEISDKGWSRLTPSVWLKASPESAPDFPQLSWKELEDVTLGVYQLKMGELYNRQHMNEDGHYVTYVHKDAPDVVRARLQSRYSKSSKHDLWIRYTNGDGIAKIGAYYCDCKCGARVVGCCSHIASVSSCFC